MYVYIFFIPKAIQLIGIKYNKYYINVVSNKYYNKEIH